MGVLILDAELKHALSITQSLGEKGIDVSCVSTIPSAPVKYSKYCKEYFVSPVLGKKKEYIKFVAKILKNGNYDLVIPCCDLSTEYISENKDAFSQYTNIFLPSHEIVKLALHKDRLMKFCEDNGINAP